MVAENKDVVSVSLAKLMEKTTKTIKLEAGEHRFCGRITMDAEIKIKKSDDTMYTPTVSIPLKAVLAIALQKAGVQRDRIQGIIVEAMVAAHALGEKAEELMNVTDEAMDRVTKTLRQLPQKSRAGATCVDGEINFVDIHPAVSSLKLVDIA